VEEAPWVILADDFTGAADCALAFRWPGAVVTTHAGRLAELVGGPGLVSVDLGTRHAPPPVAHRCVLAATALARHLGAVVFKKMDSRLRGNPGWELAGALAAWPGAVAVATPALPSHGRAVVGGRLEGEGPGGEVDVGDRLTGPAGRPQLHISLAELRAGEAGRLLRSVPGGAVVTADSEDEADLRALVAGATAAGRPVLWAGSAGLAAAVATARPAAAPGAVTGGATRGPAGSRPSVRGVIVVVGTSEPRAAAQVERLARAGARAVVVDGDGRVEAATRAAAAAELEGDGVVVLTTPVPRGRGRDPAYCAGAVAAAVSLGLAARRGLVATGGDTARALLDALGETAAQLVGPVEPGVPMLVTQRHQVVLVTKAGSFGTEGTLVAAVTALHALGPGSLPGDRPCTTGGHDE
jgi:4-hydroxythreonine-4-phosphate dehydrogenase